MKPVTNPAFTTTSLTQLTQKAEEMKAMASGEKDLRTVDKPSFGERLTESLEQVADAQKQAQQLTADFETGKEDDLTKVMISQQVSSLGFQLALNVRNKALSAYRDIINMPV
jgi:flagellar hook-basal body complex protein FliE